MAKTIAVRGNRLLQILSRAAHQLLLIAIVTGFQISASGVFADDQTASAKECKAATTKLSTSMNACLTSIENPKTQPGYMSSDNWENYYLREREYGQRALDQMRADLEKSERDAWFKKFREENFQRWWNETGGAHDYVQKRQQAVAAANGFASWDAFATYEVDYTRLTQKDINDWVQGFIEEAWNAYAEVFFQKYLDQLMWAAVQEEQARLRALADKYHATMAKLITTYTGQFGACFIQVGDLLSLIRKSCGEAAGYQAGVGGLYCAAVNTTVAACKATCVVSFEYEIIVGDENNCWRCEQMNLPMCWPATAQVPLSSRACPEAGRAQSLCLNNCSATDKACRNNCAAINSMFWDACMTARLSTIPTPTSGPSQKTGTQGNRTNRAARTESATAKVRENTDAKSFGAGKSQNDGARAVSRKNNLDRFGLGPTYVDTSSAGVAGTSRGAASTKSMAGSKGGLKSTISQDAVSTTPSASSVPSGGIGASVGPPKYNIK